MGFECRVNAEEKLITMKVIGQFDFSIQKPFREAYRYHQDPGYQFEIDLSSAEYMDSAALGMLMLLKEHADTVQCNVKLVNPSVAIGKLLEVAKFGKLFEIRY